GSLMVVENARQCNFAAVVAGTRVSAPVDPVAGFIHCIVLDCPGGAAAIVLRTVSQSDGATASTAPPFTAIAPVVSAMPRSGPNGRLREEQPARIATTAAARPVCGRPIWRRFSPPP